MTDDLEFDFALDEAMDLLAGALDELEQRIDEARRGLGQMRIQHAEGEKVQMFVNAAGIVQQLGTKTDRAVGKLHVLTLAQSWRQ